MAKREVKTDLWVYELLKENTGEEKTTNEIIKDAQELHEYLRNYGNLRDQEKPLIVSGIMLALREMEFGNFSIDFLTGDYTKTDGMKIMEAIKSNLKRSRVSPEAKKDKLITQFKVIEDTPKLNEVDATLGKIPLKMYTEFLYQKLYKTIRYTSSSEDYLG